MKKYILVLFLLFIPLIVNADNTVKVECEKIKLINVNDELICRLTASGNDNYDKISLDISNTEGIKIIDVRSNYSERWKVDINNNIATFNANELQSGLQEFGIILIKALSAGEQTLTLDNIVLENTKDNKQIEINKLTENLKVISSDNTLKSILIDDKEIDNFNSDNTKYYLNISSDFKVDAISNNDFAKIEGIGSYKIDSKDKNMIIPIKVISENGISKIYSLYINYSNDVKGLNSINIKNDSKNSLIIGFKSDINEYNIECDTNTKSLSIIPELSEGYSFVKGYGAQEVKLLSGNNMILIKVKDDTNIYTYIINVVKPILNKSNNNYIESLIIKDYKLSFNKRVKNYSLDIASNVNKLDIQVKLENKDAKYIISGNNDLQDGSVIKIEVVAPNEEKTTYKINIKVKDEENKTIIIIGLIIAIIILTMYLNIDKIKSKSRKNNIIKDVKKKEITKNNTVKKETPKTINNKQNKSTKSKQTSKSTTKKSSSKTNTKKLTSKATNNSKSTRNPKNNYTKKNNTKKKKSSKKKK